MNTEFVPEANTTEPDANNNVPAAASPADMLDEVNRATILNYTRYPKLGNWYPITYGLTAGIWVAAYALPIWAQLPLWIAIVAGAGAAISVYNKKRGTHPDPRKAPTLIRREMIHYLIGATIYFVVVAALFELTAWWLSAGFAAIGCAAGTAVYERRYERAAIETEVDAGITATVL